MKVITLSLIAACLVAYSDGQSTSESSLQCTDTTEGDLQRQQIIQLLQRQEEILVGNTFLIIV